MTSRARRARPPARWLAAVALAVTAACGGDAAGPGPGPVSAAHSVVTVSRAVLVSGTLAELLLETRDATGRRVRVGGRTVVFAAAGGTSAGVVSPATDQGDGTYSASFTGVTAGTPTTIGATVDGQAVTQPLPTIEVVPGPLSPIASFVTVTPRTIVVGGQATFTLVTADAVGNELGAGGREVRFAVSGGTSAGTIGPVTDHATGRYTAAFTATVRGTPLTVGATVDGVPVAPPLPTLTVAHGVSADSSTVSVSSDTVTVHGSVAVTLHVRDSAGVARHSGGEVVAFLVLGGAGSGLGTIDSTADRDDGTYTATFTATAAGQPVGIGATLNGRALGGTATVTILPVALSPQKSTVRVSRDTVAAGGSAMFTLEVRDLDSNRVTAGGLAVRFTLDDDGTSGGAIGATTDHDDGSYSATFTGTAAGTPVTVGATINDSTRVQMLDTLGVSHLPTVTVDPGPPAPDSSLLAASPAQVELGDSATLRLETRDAYGNALRSGGRSVAFQRGGGFGVSAGRISAVTDHGDGSYSARYRADTAGRADTIRATVDGTPLTSPRPTITVVCTAASVSPGLSEVTVNDTTAERAAVKHVTLPSGVSTTVTLWARDHRACPVTVPVTVVLTAGGGTSSGVLSAVVDQGNGTHIAAFTGATAGTATAIVATVDGQTVTSSPATIVVAPGDISSQMSVVTASRAAVDSGARATVRLRARDAAGNDLTRGGRGVTFAVAGGAGHGTVGPTTDRGDGTYTAEYAGHIVDPGRPDTITARIEGTPVHTPSPAIAVVAGTISPAQSVVTVAGGTVAAGDSVRVALRGRDAAGRALVTGDRPDAIAFTQNGGSAGVFQAVSNRDDGSYETFFHGRVAGGATQIGATIAGAPVTTALPAVTVTAGPAAVTTSRVVVAADSVGVGDTTTIELEVFDAFGNPVSDPGLSVVFAVAPSGVGAVSAAAYRSGNRHAARFTGLAPGTAMVGASIGGAAVTTAPAVVRVT